MKRRTRKWSFVAQEAQRLADLGLSPREIAQRLELNKSTVTRWIAAGKLKVPAKKVVDFTFVPADARSKKSPAEWAKAVRAEYDLDETDDQLVTLAEQALAVSYDPLVNTSVRMSASGRFQAIVRQLSLVTRGADASKPSVPEPGETAAAAKKNPPVPRRAGADPRKVLMMGARA